MIKVFSHNEELFKNETRVFYSAKGAFCTLPTAKALQLIATNPDVFFSK